MAQRILLFSPVDAWSEALSAELKGAGVAVERISDLSRYAQLLVERPQALNEPPEMVLVDVDGPQNEEGEDWRSRRASLDIGLSAWTHAQPTLPVLTIADRRKRSELMELLKEDHRWHLTPRDEGTTTSEILLTVRRHLGRDGFGLPEGIMKSCEPVSHQVRSSQQKDELLGSLGRFMEKVGVHRRVAASARMVADEFIVNAVYNAPVDEKGNHLYRHRDRRQSVELAPKDEARFFYACDGDFLAVGVRDGFGSLKADTVRAYLLRAMQGGQDQIEQKKGGAGLGLFVTLEASNKLFITIKPGEGTEFLALFAIGGSYKTFASRPKSFHLQVV